MRIKNKKQQRDTEEIFNIPPYLIKPNPSLARTEFPDTSLVSLADSIRRYGILQPLAVRLSENGKYELIAGERRLRAAVLLGLATVPCVMLSKDSNFEYLSVVENIQREKLNMFDEARAIKRLYERSGENLSKTSKLLSVGEAELKRKLLLTKFSRAEMQAILRLGICERTAVHFLEVPESARYYAIKACAERNFSEPDVKKLCGIAKEKNNLSPDDLEEIISVYFSQDTENRADKTPDIPQNSPTAPAKGEKLGSSEKNNEKIILRDLRAFENTLERSCEIFRKAGFSADLTVQRGKKETRYVLEVRGIN